MFAGYEFLESSLKTPVGGFAVGLSVEDAYKMEGHHQRTDSPVLVVVDEAKAIADPVFEAIDKCTPTFKIIVSSAGPASGRLYRIFTSESKYWFRRKVTYRECPHLSETQRLIDLELYPAGEASTFYRNKWLSEFASDSGEAIISLDSLRACQAKPPAHQPGIVTAGCDFAAGGGDSCVLAIANGNRLEVVDSWKHHNPKSSAGRFINLFRKLGLKGHQISGDAGGLGVGFIYDLQASRFYIKAVNNNSSARKSELYANLAAELWDQFNVLVENKRVILPNNDRLIAELSNRRKEYDSKGRIKLESKEDMKARGASSPDLADAAILAMMAPGAWGSFTANLNPAGAQHQAEQWDYLAELQVRHSTTLQWGSEGPGAVDFSRLW